MTTRRKFLTDATKLSALAFLPLHSRLLFTDRPYNSDTIIDSVEIIRVTGPFTSNRGIDRQPQTKPTNFYSELRPVPYKDNAGAGMTTNDLTHEYIRIRTKGGLEGLYGEIEPATVAPILEQLRPFLIGKDALAVETLWDQLYKNNRHSRAGYYMMAMSAVDNALWGYPW
ncbi:MAG: hypothetical protein WDN26_02480 [Chitinophagaceae bacterium]